VTNAYVNTKYLLLLENVNIKGELQQKSCFCSRNENVEADFGNLQIEFLGEFKAIFETVSACESGPKGVD
jgi:hypothetical protein